jgi:hypothetical protein
MNPFSSNLYSTFYMSTLIVSLLGVGLQQAMLIQQAIILKHGSRTFLAKVMQLSAYRLSSFALAKVVSILSCWMSCVNMVLHSTGEWNGSIYALSNQATTGDP